MNKTYIALAFLITGFLLAGNAYGEDEVYYCADIAKNGLILTRSAIRINQPNFLKRSLK